MKNIFTLVFACAALFQTASGQFCPSAMGNQTSYGTNNVWTGYVYDSLSFTNYVGYVNEGTAASTNFDQNFGGDNVTYATNGCSINTSTFSVRYKLTKTFASGNYTFGVGGDDGFRLSLDGGATWVINRFYDQSYASIYYYTVDLNGTYNMVLEYYENGGANRVTFRLQQNCAGTEDQSIYGTGNIWRGYVYQGTNFERFKGVVTEGTPSNPYFDQQFGGNTVTYNTSSCSILTDTFSVRYRLRKTFSTANFSIVVGGDDGYRFSLDGGATWLINNWSAHTYTTTTYTATLNGTFDMVLEYFENMTNNRVTFNLIQNTTLPISLVNFFGTKETNGVNLNWEVSSESNADLFEVEKSLDGIRFAKIGQVAGIASRTNYSYLDAAANNARNYYRLKMTDLDGKVIYSKVIGLGGNTNTGETISLYPTVITGTSVYLQSAVRIDQARIIVSDASGRVVAQRTIGQLQKGQLQSIETSNTKLPAGMYFLQLLDGSEHIATKRVIVK